MLSKKYRILLKHNHDKIDYEEIRKEKPLYRLRNQFVSVSPKIYEKIRKLYIFEARKILFNEGILTDETNYLPKVRGQYVDDYETWKTRTVPYAYPCCFVRDFLLGDHAYKTNNVKNRRFEMDVYAKNRDGCIALFPEEGLHVGAFFDIASRYPIKNAEITLNEKKFQKENLDKTFLDLYNENIIGHHGSYDDIVFDFGKGK